MGLSTRLPKPGDYLHRGCRRHAGAADRAAPTARCGPSPTSAAIAARRWRRAAAMPAPSSAPITAGPTMAPASFWAPPTRWASPASILSSHGLVRLPAAERHGLMFVRPKPMRRGREPERSTSMPISVRWCPISRRSSSSSYPIFSADRVSAAHQLEVRHRYLPRGLSHPASASEDDRAVLHRQCRHLRRRGAARPHVRGAHLDRRACAPLAEGERNYRPHVISDLPALPQHHPDLAGRPHRDLARLP